jgi:hypothetical protein
MTMYKIDFGVWAETGWQHHDIASRKATDLQEARDVASKMIAICPEQVIATITDAKGKKVEELGW